MTVDEQEVRELEQSDAADQRQVKQAEKIVLRVVEEQQPPTISELS